MPRCEKLVAGFASALTLWTGLALAQSAEEVQQIQDALPKKATVKPAKKRKLLVFSLATGFKHDSIPYGEKAFELMGNATGAYEPTLSTDMAVFEPSSLKQFDAILMNNTTGELFTTPTLQQSLMDFVKNGKGIVGIHSASDCCYSWPSYGEMIGGYFSGHPWTSDCKVSIKIDEPTHPLAKVFGGAGFDITDEIYQFRDPYSRHKLRVLTSLDVTKTDMTRKGINRTDDDFAVSWVKPFGKGRVFYCSLGHNKHIYYDAKVLQHYLDGIQFALGDLKAESSPILAKALESQNKAVDKTVSGLKDYDYGKPESASAILDSLVRTTAGVPAARKALAERLVALAVSDSYSLPARELAFRRVGLCANENDAKPLFALLKDKDPKIVEWARYALTPIPGESINKALREALGGADEKLAAGIISSLGTRKDRGAVKDLAKLAGDSSPVIAMAAITALGKIGTSDAAKILQGRMAKAGDAEKLALGNALCQCAGELASNGNKSAAKSIYDRLINTKGAFGFRLAAFTGSANLSGNPADTALKALLGNDADLHSAAGALLARSTDSSVNRKLASAIKGQKPESQIALLEIVRARDAKEALGATRGLLDAETTTVKSAAIVTLGKIGDESIVEKLLLIAGDKDSEFREQARGSLDLIPSAKADDVLIAFVSKAPAGESSSVQEGAVVEAIQVLGRRKTAAAVPELLKTASSPNEKYATESYKSLAGLAKAEHAKTMLELNGKITSAKVRTEADKALLAAIRKMEPAESQSAFLVAAVEPAPTPEARASILRLLGKLGGKDSYAALHNYVKSDDKTIKDAAIRAVAEFPTAEPLADLIALCRDEATEKVHKVLALRGAVRMLSLDSARDRTETVKLAKDIIELASTDDDKKLVISGLAEVKQPGILEMLSPFMDNPALVAETQAAVLKLAPDVWAYSPQETSATLAKINRTELPESQQKDLKKVEDDMVALATTVVGWQASGPFSDPAATTLETLLKHKFDPEAKGEEAVTWKTVTAGSNNKHPEMLELDKTFGSPKNCAAYLRTFLISDEPSTASLQIGSDDGILVWVNGQEVLSTSVKRSYKKGQDKIMVPLNQGKNELLAKVTQGTGTWRASVLVESPDGGALPGLTITAVPSETK
jgi:type 1 glutamine amidotransferase/HEAT repeat protein